MDYYKDIAGIAVKNATIEQRKQVAEICLQRNIQALTSITLPDNKLTKAHPHIQYHSGLVDSFRGRHPNFVSFDNFISNLKL